MAGILSNGMHIQLVPLYLPSFLLNLSRVVSIRAVVASRVLARRIKENPPWNTVRAPQVLMRDMLAPRVFESAPLVPAARFDG